MFSTSHIRYLNVLYTALCVICIWTGCADHADRPNPSPGPPPSSGEEPTLADGCKRLYLSFGAGVEIRDASVIVNGRSYLPVYNQARGQWYIDAVTTAFDVYSAELVQEGSLIWYDGTPNSDIHIPSVQFMHKSDELTVIPQMAEYDADIGNVLNFLPPYAALEFELEGMSDIVSLKLSSETPLCGSAVWSRTNRNFTFNGDSNVAVLNCTNTGGSGPYRILVFGQNHKNVTLRVCSSSHKAREISLGDLELSPGAVYRRSLDVSPEKGLLLFEGFDRCVWGGDILAGTDGVAPSDIIPSLDGDVSKDGYEYALATVTSDTPGSGYIQNSFAYGQQTVQQNHNMSDSYIASRGFDGNRFMLRCRECPGYISVGTGDGRRGWFALHPLGSAGLNTVRNLEISFKVAFHKTCTDDLLLLVNGSEDAITGYYIDETEGQTGAVSQCGTSDTLRLTPDALGKGKWRNVRVRVDNCTDLTALHWLAASTEDGSHGFYLDEISVREVKDSWNQQGKLRILYWNIQNGMWGDQPGYDNFVSFVKKYSPDVCVWCEAKSNHETDSESSWKDPYLPDNWTELASRYGHGYTAISRRGTEKFPQVVTSKFPIEKLLQIGDVPEGDPVLHGAGLFEICLQGGAVHILTIHLKPNSGLSVAEGEKYRTYELKHILDETIDNPDYGDINNWIVLGDFNADSRKDAPFHNYIDAGTHYLVHDYIAENTSLIDVLATRYPGTFMYTTASSRRIDYVYMDPAFYAKVADACVLTEGWTAPVETGVSNFCKPSDHRPILIDMKY